MNSLKFILILSLISCSSKIARITDVKMINENNKKNTLDLSGQIVFDNHSGKVMPDSEIYLYEVLDYLSKHPSMQAKIIVFYSNGIGRHIETAHLMSYDLYEYFVNNGISENRLSFDIDVDKANTYSPFSSYQKVWIILKFSDKL